MTRTTTKNGNLSAQFAQKCYNSTQIIIIINLFGARLGSLQNRRALLLVVGVAAVASAVVVVIKLNWPVNCKLDVIRSLELFHEG